MAMIRGMGIVRQSFGVELGEFYIPCIPSLKV